MYRPPGVDAYNRLSAKARVHDLCLRCSAFYACRAGLALAMAFARGGARDLSVVLYGASGFTGRLVAHYLAARGGTGRIGLAGRCRQKLEAVAAETARAGWEPDVLVAEADDHAALSALGPAIN